MYNAMMVGWDRSIPGREASAYETFGKWNGYLAQEQAAGRIAGFEHCFLQFHGGSFNGFTMVKGTYAQLCELEGGEVFTMIMTEANQSMMGMSHMKAFTGDAMMQQMARWQKTWTK